MVEGSVTAMETAVAVAWGPLRPKLGRRQVNNGIDADQILPNVGQVIDPAVKWLGFNLMMVESAHEGTADKSGSTCDKNHTPILPILETGCQPDLDDV